eukprot:gene2510-5465_t
MSHLSENTRSLPSENTGSRTCPSAFNSLLPCCSGCPLLPPAPYGSLLPDAPCTFLPAPSSRPPPLPAAIVLLL